MFTPPDSYKGQLPQHRMKPDLRPSDNNGHTNSLGEISGAPGAESQSNSYRGGPDLGHGQGPPPQPGSLAR